MVEGWLGEAGGRTCSALTFLLGFHDAACLTLFDTALDRVAPVGAVLRVGLLGLWVHAATLEGGLLRCLCSVSADHRESVGLDTVHRRAVAEDITRAELMSAGCGSKMGTFPQPDGPGSSDRPRH